MPSITIGGISIDTTATDLSLSHLGLTILPDSIGQLTRLTELDVSGNRLSTLPDSIGQLTSLTGLNARINEVITIPETLRGLTELYVILDDYRGSKPVVHQLADGTPTFIKYNSSSDTGFAPVATIRHQEDVREQLEEHDNPELENYWYSYYDFVDPRHIKPLIPTSGDVRVWGLSRDEFRGLPAEITEANFDQFLPSVSSRTYAPYDGGDHTDFYYGLSGLEDFVKSQIEVRNPQLICPYRDRDGPADRANCRERVNTGFYTGGWQRAHLTDYIERHRDLLPRLFHELVIRRMTPSKIANGRLNELIRLVQLVQHAVEHPDFRVSDWDQQGYAISTLPITDLWRLWSRGRDRSDRNLDRYYQRLWRGPAPQEPDQDYHILVEAELRIQLGYARQERRDASDYEDRDDIINLPVDIDERGRGYLPPFVRLAQTRARQLTGTGRTLGYRLRVGREAGLDYSGVYRDVVSDLVEFWFPTLEMTVDRSSQIAYQVNYPRFVEGTSPNDLGYVLGYLVHLVKANPTVMGESLQLGLGLEFDTLLWRLIEGQPVTLATITGAFLRNLDDAGATSLVGRLVENRQVTIDKLRDYGFINSVVKVVTNSCDSIEAVNRLLHAGEHKRLMLAIIGEQVCRYTGLDDEITEQLTPPRRHRRGRGVGERPNLGDLIERSLRGGVRESSFISTWITLYGQAIAGDRQLSQFVEGFLRYLESNNISIEEARRLMAGDGLTETTIKPKFLEALGREYRAVFSDVLGQLEYREIRQLLKFWTGSTQLPTKLQITRVRPSDRLPEAHTCFNKLDIPGNLLENSNLLVRRLRVALEHGLTGIALA